MPPSSMMNAGIPVRTTVGALVARLNLAQGIQPWLQRKQPDLAFLWLTFADRWFGITGIDGHKTTYRYISKPTASAHFPERRFGPAYE